MSAGGNVALYWNTGVNVLPGAAVDGVLPVTTTVMFSGDGIWLFCWSRLITPAELYPASTTYV